MVALSQLESTHLCHELQNVLSNFKHLTDWKVKHTVSTMEIDEKVARKHLAEVDGAMRAATDGQLIDPPSWWFPVVALFGPAIVAFFAATSDVEPYGVRGTLLLRAVSVAAGLIAVIGMVHQYRMQRRARVRARAPIFGGKTTPWMFLFNLPYSFVTIVLLNAMTVSSPARTTQLVLAVASFLMLTFVPMYAWRRHSKEMRQP